MLFLLLFFSRTFLLLRLLSSINNKNSTAKDRDQLDNDSFTDEEKDLPPPYCRSQTIERTLFHSFGLSRWSGVGSAYLLLSWKKIFVIDEQLLYRIGQQRNNRKSYKQGSCRLRAREKENRLSFSLLLSNMFAKEKKTKEREEELIWSLVLTDVRSVCVLRLVWDAPLSSSSSASSSLRAKLPSFGQQR